MVMMVWIKAYVGIIKKKLREYYFKSSITMMRILGIKEIVGELMKELNHEDLNADIRNEMEKSLRNIQELRYRLLQMEVALKAQPSNFQPKSMRIPANKINIHNHDVSGGLQLRNPDSCVRFVVSPEFGYPEGLSEKLRGCRFAVIQNRKEGWHGLEQDITNRVSNYCSYALCAWVGLIISRPNPHQKIDDVLIHLNLKYRNSPVAGATYLIGRTSASTDRWEKVECVLCPMDRPDGVSISISGPPPGVDLLIRSVSVSCVMSSGYGCCDKEEVIQNPRFEDGLSNWSGIGLLDCILNIG